MSKFVAVLIDYVIYPQAYKGDAQLSYITVHVQIGQYTGSLLSKNQSQGFVLPVGGMLFRQLAKSKLYVNVGYPVSAGCEASRVIVARQFGLI